jgi:diguanylate cyclase (GGDEF)-like protein
MNLKPRILLLTGLLVIASAAAAWWVARQQAVGIVEQWAVRYAEKQILYDKYRALQPVLREIALARQLAASPQIREWAHKPDDVELTRRGMAEMESFRLNFADQNYFLALRASGRYYHNNAQNEFAGRQLRYSLDPKKAADRWFYDIIAQRREMHINVNPDVNLGVTKLWIDVLIRDGDEILGVAGTGLDLSRFIRDVVDNAQPGITSLFIDHEGAIQAYRDQRLIDFASITKSVVERNTIDLLFDRSDDRQALRAAMQELEKRQAGVVARFVEMHGKSYLAGIAYLPEIDWYEITLLDLEVILPLASFSGILLVYCLTLLAALVLFNLVLGRLVLRPMAQLEQAIQKVQEGQFSPESLPTGGKNEIGRLMRHFKDMAQTVWQTRSELEGKVRERTEALERLTQTDPLTELLNRRGMAERIEAERCRSQREQSCFGLLWLDVDLFKEINDQYGHRVGDQALVLIAELIRSTIRPYDSAARWGGDEFLVLVQGCDAGTLERLGERLCAAVADTGLLLDGAGQSIALSLSIGGALADGEAIESVLSRADQALYAAKAAGRNCLRLSLLADDCGHEGGRKDDFPSVM